MEKFNALRVFTEVCERRSFIAAARALHMPRSTVSETIQDLEAHLGVRLLARTTRRVDPTPAGYRFYARVVALLRTLDDMERGVGAPAAGASLTLAAPSALSEACILPLLHRFRQSYPEMTLSLELADHPAAAALAATDCVFLMSEDIPPGYEARPLLILEGVSVASPDYSLGTGQGYEEATPSADLPAPIVSGSLSIRMAAALHGMDTAHLPRFLAQDALQRGLLVPLPASKPAPEFTLMLAHPPYTSLRPNVQIFVDWIAETFGLPSRAEVSPPIARKASGRPRRRADASPARSRDAIRQHVRNLLIGYSDVG